MASPITILKNEEQLYKASNIQDAARFMANHLNISKFKLYDPIERGYVYNIPYYVEEDEYVFFAPEAVAAKRRVEMEERGHKNARRVWLIPANPNDYDLELAFQRFDTIDWRRSYNYENGDLLFIYVSGHIKQVRYKAEVVQGYIDLSDNTYNEQFWADKEKFEQAKEWDWTRIRLLDEVDTPQLSLEQLRNHGLKSNIQGSIKLTGELRDYIMNTFEEGKLNTGEVKEKLADEGISAKTNVDVPTAVWLATATLAFEAYHLSTNPTVETMYFKQKEIQNRAQEYCGKNVENARISQWYNADHVNHTYNFLRQGEDATRRLSYPGEFNGIKEQPELDEENAIQTTLGVKAIGDIKRFIESEYTALFATEDTNNLMNNIECISILDYLEAYGGQAYESPERVDDSKRQHYLDIKAAGSSAVKELDKMAELCAGRFGLIKSRPSKWLTGGNNKVRNYLWMQLKLAGYESSPTSLSLFAEIVGEQARFKFSVELHEAQSTKEDYQKHHRLLDRDISTASDKLFYILSGNQFEKEMEELSLTTEEIKRRVEDGTYKKIQMARVITRKDIEEELHDNSGIINGMLKAVEALMPFYQLTLDKSSEGPFEIYNEENEDEITMENTNKNMILYGPPGTGKTYNTVTYAVSIIENQSLENIQKEDYTSVFERYNRYKDQGRIAFTTFHQSYGYEEFIEGIKPVISKQVEDEKTDIQYEYASGIFKRFCEKANNTINQSEKNGQNNNKPYVFIIDEINRGNISKIFGELITLIEPTKRLGEEEATTAILPYTGDEFGVPNNIYFLGTMNTADRSIAQMDTALRRRFQFIEMMPDENVLTKLNIQEIEGINIQKVLKTINERIEYLYDREHTIGHAYFISLANDPTIDKLAEIFLNAMIPLLQEYFYEDYSKIQLVLGDNAKVDASFKFILDTDIKVREVFKGNPDIDLPEKKYSIQTEAFYKEESYKLIY